ncbi:hypothetical protein ACM01_32105 [Streptomyces viridochromogenes]|uniref:Uncharacterized protein n=1 Tax=Streptomyces viridochromogenes TaxID=1938 RepID=A0A0J7Z471_STRVR|nr:hypothetical protein [Streptomyces viridochromogenes]KMS70342.1 hypothetical protein ACM01_32105 [Streptomyces viridochromogenes]
MPNGTAPVAMERLRELTVPELYQRNAFRVTGISTMATRRTIRQQKQHITTAARAGVDIPAPGELPVPGRRSVEQYGAAFDVIDHPQRRIVDELFWLWDAPDGACGCDPALHRAHDAAVRAHARALDEELSGGTAPAEGEGSWGAAAAGWQDALGHPGFWDHLRHRVTALDDHRLAPSALSALEDELRRTLIAPLAVLAARAAAPQRMIGLFGAWSWAGERLLGEAVEQQLRPELDSAQLALDRARDQQAEHTVRAVSIVEKEIVPQLTRLRAFDAEGVRRTVSKLTDRAALLLNNCVISPGSGPSLPAGEDARLLDLALALAETAETRRIVTGNRKHLALNSVVKSMERVRKLLDDKQTAKAVAEMRNRVLPILTELRQSEDGEKRQSAAKLGDTTAILLNNCAIALSPGTAPSPAQESFELLDEAAKLAETRQARKLIRKNRRRLNDHSRLGPYTEALDATLSGLKRAQELLRGNKPDRAASELQERVLPQVKKLGECRAWKIRFAASRLSDQTAVLLNNCAVALVPEVSAPKQQSIRLLKSALTVARKGKTRRLVTKNLDGFQYAERIYGNDRLSTLSGLGSSNRLIASPGIDDQRLSYLPSSVRDALMRMSPEQRAEFLSRYRDLL